MKLLDDISNKSDHWSNGPADPPNEEMVGLLVPKILLLIGIPDKEISKSYPTTGRRDPVDYAARLISTENSLEFSLQPKNPDLIIEIKRPSKTFIDKGKEYFKAVEQLNRYFAGSKCKSVRFGLIFNGLHLQLFRKHDQLSYPITSILSTRRENIKKTISILKKRIEDFQDKRGSIISVWNNKGGVGKTSIAQSLSILLSRSKAFNRFDKNKILVIDYDHNQGDLTNNCGLPIGDGITKELLEKDIKDELTEEFDFDKYLSVFTNKNRKPKANFEFEIKVLRADSKLSKLGEKYSQYFSSKNKFPLRELCLKLSKRFDYIIIDSPPNYEQSIFSKESIMASDCILPIGLYANKNSLINFAKFAKNDIKDAQIARFDGGPHILGLWINKWRRSWTERYTRECVQDIIESTNKEDRLELERIFYKKFIRRLDLRKITERAEIARCIMDSNGLPGVVRFNSARVALQSLLKEFVE